MLMPYFPKVNDGPLATHTSTIPAEDSHKIRSMILTSTVNFGMISIPTFNFGMIKAFDKFESLTIYLGIWYHATTATSPIPETNIRIFCS